ncbi:glycogen debranching protein GlgX [Amnibacterium kyonggiense]|uniref:Glycogen operon protein n=1 Tax=Amnibacterium kyonggiense TaxID=595671 RepID=A0A4R7FS75_9MICO|nr:glycogen debranching protein GlgX [Amnibacterium kyonggiense]TDS80702.1 glycogen operon protein [Amnibacterium kyonggiense]
MTDRRSRSYPLGVTLEDGGANVSVYSETASKVFFCSFDGDEETRTELRHRTGYVWHDFVEGVEVGTRYGLRVDGPWDPANGLRHNVNKLLLDPHALAVTGEFDVDQRLFGHDMDEPEEMDASDSASAMPRCVVVDRSFDWGDDPVPTRTRVPLEETVVYETHVKGFTKRMPGVPEELQGTYAGLAHPKAIQHLVDLGITSVELLPVHQFVHDQTLKDKGLSNYWGYNSIAFLAPHGAYSSAGDTGEQVAEFKAMVKALHAAGLEVILDVVFNHTAEGNHMGPTIAYKGLDNGAYYRLVEEQRDAYFDTTGTGNSLNVSHPAALGLIMDSLRYWVQEMHVDGFRFDLATTLTRQGGEASLRSAFLDLTLQDPVLQPIKLIAEPWDTAGYQVGGFPAEWSEWNGKFRDDVRDFWSGAESLLGTTSQRVLGSPDVYQPDRRSPLCSVNFITAHDGFTLADLTAYAEKHNEANGEDNNDGESDNKSFNGGAEGPTDDAEVNAYRLRQRKNFLATLLLSTGVPMLLGGDELGRTQGGNNNAYCQDNEISWYDWDAVDEDLLAFTKRLLAIRRENEALRPSWYHYAPADGVTDWVVLKRSDDQEFAQGDWDDPEARTITFVLGHEGGDTFALLLNSAGNGVEFQVPAAPGGEWELALSSDPEQVVEGPVTTLIVRDASFTLLRSAAA